MLRFGFPEGTGGSDFGNGLSRPDTRRVDVGDGLLGGAPLFVGGVSRSPTDSWSRVSLPWRLGSSLDRRSGKKHESSWPIAHFRVGSKITISIASACVP